MANENIIQLTAQNFKQEVEQASTPVLVDFWAPWCGPCRAVAPVLDKLADQYSGKIKIAKVNVDEEQVLASQFGVMSIPTLILFKGGLVVSQVVGARSSAELEAMFQKVL